VGTEDGLINNFTTFYNGLRNFVNSSRGEVLMTRKILGTTALAGLAAGILASCVTNASAQGIPVLGAGDTAIGIDADAVFGLNGRYPAAEGPANAINPGGTKYLNFGEAGSGFIVTPAVVAGVESFQIRTANDAPSRDPSSWELYGFNGTLTTMDSGASPLINADGLAEAWTLLGSGGVTLPGDPTIGNDQRGVLGPLVDVPTTAAYQHYKMIFPTVKDAALANSMQIDSIQFYSDNAGTTGILAPGNPIVAVDPIKDWSGSGFPGGENPARGIDQSVDPVTLIPNTKYLNFGGAKSGLIITNSEGPVQLKNMQLTTGNDAPGRDPASFELYGTNDPIVSTDNTDGNQGEAYTLIASGSLTLPDARNTLSSIVAIDSPAAYTSYKLIFPTLKDPASTLMQIDDVQFFAIPEPATTALALVGLAAGVCLRRKS
jgi:hypothetical protein